MPIYEFICGKCSNEFEALVRDAGQGRPNLVGTVAKDHYDLLDLPGLEELPDDHADHGLAGDGQEFLLPAHALRLTRRKDHSRYHTPLPDRIGGAGRNRSPPAPPHPETASPPSDS